MNKQPIYPKEDPEYRKKVMARFYEQVRNTKWNTCDDNEYQGKPRGRKAKIVERPKAQPRPGEKYNWFN